MEEYLRENIQSTKWYIVRHNKIIHEAKPINRESYLVGINTLCGVVWFGVVLYGVMLYGVVLCGVVPCGVMPCCVE